MEKQDSPIVIPVWPNGAPGSEDWCWPEQEFFVPPHNNKFLRNVTVPPLTAYLPDPGRANGTAVVVCPGGASIFLAIAHEGTEVASWPAFAAPIYGAPWEDVTVPADAPPLFLALASDDMAVRTSLPLYTKWREAGHPVELHVFSQGGHGFGMRKQNLPSDHWIDLFGNWLGAQGLLERRK